MIITANIENVRQAARDAIAQIARCSVRDDERVVSTGLIDSLSVLKLIVLLEKSLKIKIPKHQVQPDDFDSVDVILETLERIEA